MVCARGAARQQRGHVFMNTGAGAGSSGAIFFRDCAARDDRCPRRPEQQTSAAAEGACAESPLGGTVTTQASACSGAVENFKSPKHHDDSRYYGGRHQHTFQGSDSHPLTPLPSPTSGLVDSLNRLQSFGHNPIKVAARLWFAGHSGEHGVPPKEKAPGRGLFDQWCQNNAINRMIGSGTPSSQSNAPFVKSMSSSSKVDGLVTLEGRHGSRVSKGIIRRRPAARHRSGSASRRRQIP